MFVDVLSFRKAMRLRLTEKIFCLYCVMFLQRGCRNLFLSPQDGHSFALHINFQENGAEIKPERIESNKKIINMGEIFVPFIGRFVISNSENVKYFVFCLCQKNGLVGFSRTITKKTKQR